MNRRRHDTRTPASAYFALILAAAIAAVGGVLHAYYKNRQIQVSREIDAIERRIEQYQLDVRTTQMRMDQLLNRFAMRKQLEEAGSAMVSIPVSAIEEVDPAPLLRHSVAAATP